MDFQRQRQRAKLDKVNKALAPALALAVALALAFALNMNLALTLAVAVALAVGLACTWLWTVKLLIEQLTLVLVEMKGAKGVGVTGPGAEGFGATGPDIVVYLNVNGKKQSKHVPYHHRLDLDNIAERLHIDILGYDIAQPNDPGVYIPCYKEVVERDPLIKPEEAVWLKAKRTGG